MSEANLPLRIKRGDTFSFVLNFTDSTANLVGSSVRSQIRESAAAGANLIVDWGTIAIVSDKVDFSLTTEQTSLLTPGSYVYDVELISASGKVFTFLEGQVWIDGDVTQ